MRTPAATALTAVAIAVALATALTTWIVAAEHRGEPPPGSYAAHAGRTLHLSGPDAEAHRRALLARAELRLPAGVNSDATPARPSPAANEDVACRFVAAPPSGTSAKFDCVLDGGEVVKVKYGRNPELQAEAAATRLFHALGYAADRVDIVPRLRCYGCPRYPFVTMKLLTFASSADRLAPNGYEAGYTDFRWVSIEHRFAAPAIETEATAGWAWWEMAQSAAPRAEIDAFRLLAVFLAHWDNKSSNQRLVCLDAPPPADATACRQPLAMVQDLGATFGPPKVNLARWRDIPVWEDAARCVTSMARLPWGGATFPRARISEAGRQLFSQRLAMLSDDEIRGILRTARFPEYQPGTSEERDLDAWLAAFRDRQGQIATAQCPMRNAQ